MSMSGTVRYIFKNVVIYSASAILGFLVLLRLGYIWLTSPSGTLTKLKKRPIPPDCLNNPELGEHKYIQLKNVKLHYVEKGDPTKPLMIFLHGFPEFWYSWRHQIKHFSKDYWVIVPDLRGYGDSDKPQGTKYYQIKYLMEDIKNLIAGLERDKVIIVGHDWGGVLAWDFVLLYPDLIDTYVIMNAPYPPTFKKHMRNNLTQLRMSWYILFFQLPYLPEFFLKINDLMFLKVIFRSSRTPSPFTEEDKECYRFTFGKPGALTPPLNYYRANLQSDKKLFKSISKDVKIPPGLLLFGENDVAISVDSVRNTTDQLPNLTIEIIKDASHFVQQDVPEIINELMEDFIKKKLPKLKAEQAIESTT